MPDSPTGTLSPLPPGGGLPPEPQKQATDDERRNSLMTRLSTTHKDVKDIGEDELFNMLDKDHSGTLPREPAGRALLPRGEGLCARQVKWCAGRTMQALQCVILVCAVSIYNNPT